MREITKLVVDAGTDGSDARVTAYGLVTDWGHGGTPMTFPDYTITLNRSGDGCRIRHLLATPV